MMGSAMRTRLRELRQGFYELDGDLSRRYYYGEGHDDGMSTDDVRQVRDRAQAATHREERRQQAQYDFGRRPKPPEPED
jgi:hypothetical protein